MDLAAKDEYWMGQALQLAKQAELLGEVPVGAIIVSNDSVIGSGFNQPISACDPTAHAEIVAIRDAAAQSGNYRLVNATLYVTLEPCSMCAGAIVHSRLARVVYGASESKAGAVHSQHCFFESSFLNHQVSVTGGVCAEACGNIISGFFANRRSQKREAKLQGDSSNNTV